LRVLVKAAEKSTLHLSGALSEMAETCLSEMFTCIHSFLVQTMALIACALLSALVLPGFTLTTPSQNDSVF